MKRMSTKTKREMAVYAIEFVLLVAAFCAFLLMIGTVMRWLELN